MSLISFIFGCHKKTTTPAETKKQENKQCTTTVASKLNLAPCAAGTGSAFDSGSGLPAEAAVAPPRKSTVATAKAPTARVVQAGNIFASKTLAAVTTEPPSVSDQVSNIVDSLGITPVDKQLTVTNPDVIKEGNLIQFGYHDDLNSDYNLSINQELSTKDSLVYDGTNTNTVSGQVSYVRQTITTTADGATVIKKQTTKQGKPISENSGWNDNETLKEVPAPDGVKVYKVSSDGTETYLYKEVPKNPTTVSKIYEDGTSTDLSNVSAFKLHNISTGLDNIYVSKKQEEPPAKPKSIFAKIGDFCKNVVTSVITSIKNWFS